MKNILILGRGYLATKLSRDLSQKYIIHNLYHENNTYDLIIYANFPSTSKSFLFDYFYLKNKYIEITKSIEKNLNISQIYFNSYKIFYKTKNNFFNHLYIKYNSKIFKKFKDYISNYFLPFIYDKDLIYKENSLFYRWNNSLKLYNKDLFLPTLSYKDFLEILIQKIENYKKENYIFPSNLKTIKDLYFEYERLKNEI